MRSMPPFHREGPCITGVRIAQAHWPRDSPFSRFDLNAVNDTWETLPADLRGTVEAQLAGGEKPLVWLELDLDSHLHYAAGLLVVTDQRLLAIGPTEAVAPDRRHAQAGVPFRAWPLTAIKGLRAKEHAGVGGPRPAGRRKSARPVALYDRPRAAAHRLIDRFDRLRRGDRAGGEDRRAADHRLPELRRDPGGRPTDLPRLRAGRGQAGPGRALPAHWFCQAEPMDGPVGIRVDGGQHRRQLWCRRT